ncbi:FRG domain-containing protein [Paraburkholderia sp. J67]|uniref:FRG domain-containing protein n=1 Tax=Paraburkholderia sp. J67 TaxID=2805435 RepID=UPI002ABDCFA1|nr:FRG domain-containing protein [Paraburkholderia sp. J67]
MQTTQLTDWNQFMELTTQLDGWAFRGQQNAQWRLESSLSRYMRDYVDDHSQWRAREERAIRVFRRKAHNFLAHPDILADDLRCLALMQHHGAPTRLLDFTKSPFVAAFFALERATGDAAVYALNTPALWNNRARPKSDPLLTRDVIDPRAPGHFERYFFCNTHEILWSGEPSEMDDRLVAQSGTFVLPGVIDKPLQAILDGYETNEELLHQIVLPASLRMDAMKWLYRMNITNASLFPGLDGLARSIAVELEIVWSGMMQAP